MSTRTDGGEDDRCKQEAELDQALEQTFPASDPFSVGQFTGTEPPARPADRKAPLVDQPEAEPRDPPKVATA